MKTLIQQATEYKPPLGLRKSYKLEQMKPALADLDAIAAALQYHFIFLISRYTRLMLKPARLF